MDSSNEFQVFGSKDFYQYPYSYYSSLQSVDPVHWQPELQSWLITRHDDIVSYLGQAQLSAKRSKIDKMPAQSQEKLRVLRDFYSRWLMFSDPPKHTSVRQIISKALSTEILHKVSTVVRQDADVMLGEMKEKKSFDFLSEFASILPTYVLCHLVGIDVHDYSLIKGWSHDIVGFLGLTTPTFADGERAQASTIDFLDYIKLVIHSKENNPKNDLLSALNAWKKQSPDISEDDLLVAVANVLIDGHEPITAAICNGLLSFLEFPKQVEKVANHPQLIESAVEEVLRFDCPFQYSARVALEDLSIGGKEIKKGQRVMFMLGAGNHDIENFLAPSLFEITRDNNRHLAFGYGPHYCVGAGLARVVLRETFSALIDKLPSMNLVSNIEWRQSIGYRKIEALRISWK